VLNQKGGAGKTTISTNIAAGLSRAGGRVLLVDSDPQGSARDWCSANDNCVVSVVGLDRANLIKDVEALGRDYEVIILDGAPQVRELAAAAIKVSHAVLIPVQPSPYDVWAASDLIELIKARQEVTDGKPQAAFMVSRAVTNTKLSQDIFEALSHYSISVFKSFTSQRIAYASSAAEGKAVFDLNDGKAINEIESIVEELIQWVN